MPIYTKGDEANSHALQPSGSGSINVTGEYVWTLSNNRAEVPSATIVEYQINSGQLLAGIYYYFKQIPEAISNTDFGGDSNGLLRGGGENANPYNFLYFAKPTGFVYTLPYLGDAKFSRSNTFGHDAENSAGSVGGGLARHLGDAAKIALGTQGSHGLGWASLITAGAIQAGKAAARGAVPGKVEMMGLNNSKSWDSTSGADYVISFDLLNTFSNTNDIRKNRELAYLLTHQASPFRRNFAVMDPPCIYQLSIPDVVHFPACYISNLEISNLGNTRLLRLDGQDRTIPEAYRFSITFRSLLEESRNIFAGVENNADRVSAISDEKTAYDQLVTDFPQLLRDARGAFGF